VWFFGSAVLFKETISSTASGEREEEPGDIGSISVRVIVPRDRPKCHSINLADTRLSWRMLVRITIRVVAIARVS
jgi:hypothetical protein